MYLFSSFRVFLCCCCFTSILFLRCHSPLAVRMLIVMCSRIVQSVQCSRAHWHKQTNERIHIIMKWVSLKMALSTHTHIAHAFISFVFSTSIVTKTVSVPYSLPPSLPLSFFPDSIYLFYLLECFSIQFLTSFHLTRSELNSFFAHIRTHYTLPAHTHTHTHTRCIK